MTTPRDSSQKLPYVLALIVGIVIGWALAGSRAPVLHAGGGGDRFDESILTTGPTAVRYNEGSKIQVAQDAIYYLDFRAGRLIGTIPSIRQSVGSTKLIEGFAERDLVSDFKLDLDAGARPHFLMTTGSISTGANNTYGDGWAPLFVFESSTRQIAVYKISQQNVGAVLQIRLELLELKSYATPTRPTPSTR